MTAAPRIAAAFDAEDARRDFHILSRPVHGKPLAYLDSGASAQKPSIVLETMKAFAESEYANVHRGVHYLSGAATDRYEAARRTVQKFLNAAREEEIVFTKGGTEAMNLVAYSYLMPLVQPGDEIVLSVMEHHSNIVPWHFLRERMGAVLRWVDVRDDGSLDIAAVEAAITPKTRLVAITHMSNVLGTVTPLAEIVQRAHARGVPVLADGCQGAVHEIVDVQALDIDFYAITGHKLYGPTGIGALWGRADLLDAMPPWQGGGAMIDRVSFAGTTYAPPPQRFEAGTPAIIEAIGFGAAADYIRAIGLPAIHAHEVALVRELRDALRARNDVTLFGPEESAGIVSFALDGVHPHDLGTILDEEGVAIRAGHHCAQPLMEHLGVPATARASFGLYSDQDDIAALLRGIERTRRIFG